MPSAFRLRRPAWCAAVAVAAVFGGLVVAVPADATTTYQLAPFAGVSQTAGTAASQKFNGPNQLAVDASGNVYVANENGNVVDKITPAGVISVFAGGGSTVAVPGGGSISATSASLGLTGSDDGVAVDSLGDVFISDRDNDEVDEVTPSGQLSVVAGDGVSQLGTYPAVGPPTTAIDTNLVGSAGLAVDTSGDLFIADPVFQFVEEVNLGTGDLSVIAGTGASGAVSNGTATTEPIGRPYAIAVDASGNVYVASYFQNQLYKVSPSGQLTVIAGNGTGAVPTNGPATSSSLWYPDALTVDGSGDVFVGGQDDDDVSEIDPSGQLTVLAGKGFGGPPTYHVPATQSAIDAVQGLAYAGNDEFYVADFINQTVDLLEPYTAQTSTTTTTTTSTTTSTAPTTSTTTTTSTAPTSRSTTSTAPTTSTSTSTSASVTGEPLNQVAPSIAGTPAIGQVLEASVGGWTGSGLSYQYQWLRDSAAITRATGSSYRVSTADAGHRLAVQVMASDGTSAVSATSQTLVALSTDARGCSIPAGRLTTTSIGDIQLGMTRARARHEVASNQPLNSYTDNLCLAGGYGIRVGYAEASLLGHGTSPRSLRSRIVFATTANPYYSLDGVRPGMTVAVAAHRLHLTRPIVVGPNVWYVISGAHANHVLKTRQGVVQEVGDLNRELTRTRDEQGRLLRSF